VPIVFRPAEDGDIDAMATIRAREWETDVFWKTLYVKHGAHPLNDYWMVWDDIRSMTVPVPME
jgi:hypothetical protein